jgi:hypothetical protein
MGVCARNPGQAPGMQEVPGALPGTQEVSVTDVTQ